MLKPNLVFKICLGLLLIANLTLAGVYAWRGDGLTHIYILDVGQGDSILIQTAQNQTILIDGGPDGGVVSQLDAVLPFWKRNIDLMVLTHPHADHAAGLLAVAKRYQVSAFLYNGSSYDTHIYNALLDYMQAHEVPVQIAEVGQNYEFSPCGLTVLYADKLSESVKDPNDTSVVTELSCNQFQTLLTGDASVAVESKLLADGKVSDVEVLKVGHQGSKTSSSQIFLDAAAPSLGVISVGRNNFGHPHQEVMNRFADLGIPIYRTDEHGTIHIQTDGVSFQIV